MTGVADVYKAVALASAVSAQVLDAALFALLPGAVAAWLERRLFPYWSAELRTGEDPCPGLAMPDPRPTLAINGLGEKPVWSEDVAGVPRGVAVHSPSPRRSLPLRWGILLPLTSRPRYEVRHRGSSPVTAADEQIEEVWQRLSITCHRLVASVPPSRRPFTRVHVAVDAKDPAFDCDEGRSRLQELLSDLGDLAGTVDVAPPLPPAYNGALCWIWAELARRAAKGGAELMVLWGDDVVLDDPTIGAGGRGVPGHAGSIPYCWQQDVEDQFEAIAATRGLPFGFGVVALRDKSFAVFPTFPVVHRLHLDVFRGHLFPRELRNQHGDPYLWELYRRWGAARFTSTASLTNAIGGAVGSRYVKRRKVVWRGALLSAGITRLEQWLEDATRDGASLPAQVPCLDVVVPTYRCDVLALRRLSALRCCQPVALHTLLVVDNPSSPALAEVLALHSYAPNATVRVYVMAANDGASAARNTGLAQSFGDWAVLLDDDVVPDSGLLDAYLGAISRQPGAAAYVGLTCLPAPDTVMQRAMAACRICFFFGIAAVTDQPPWGVTANLCVPARTNDTVWFSDKYPKTGGGEDVDFCIRLQKVRGAPLVSVAGARVVHPYWPRPLAQVCGWARGDVLCLETLPHMTFRAIPNWAEIAVACMAIGVPLVGVRPALAAAALSALAEVTLLASHYLSSNVTWTDSGPFSMLVALVATMPPMLQDVVRLGSKLRRLRLEQLCLHFDWMGRQGQYVQATQQVCALHAALWVLGMVATMGSLAVPARAGVSTLACLLLATRTAAQVGGTARVSVKARQRVAQAAHVLAHYPLGAPPGAPPLFGLHLNLPAQCRGAQPFVVVAHQRTGSNHLCSYLDRTTGGLPLPIVMHYEILNANAAFLRDGRVERDARTLLQRDTDPERYVGAAWADAMLPDGTANAAAVGFKLFPEHICHSAATHETVTRIMADPRVLKVVLRRENRLAVCVSMLRASVTGVYMGHPTDELRVSIRPDDLHAFFRNYDAYYEWVRGSLVGQPAVEVTYEALVRDPAAVVRRVFDAVVGPARAARALVDAGGRFAPRSAVKRQSSASRPLQDAVVNFDALRTAFAATPWAAEFQDAVAA